MGLFSNISGSITGAGVGAFVGNLIVPGAGGAIGGAIGGAVLGGMGEDPVEQQIRALEEAGRREEAARLRQEAFMRQILGETAPFRAAARESLLQLQSEVNAPIGQSPLFRRGLQAGITGIRQNLAGTGLEESSVAGQALGEFTTGLTAQEINRRQNILSGLAGFGTLGFGTALGPAQLGAGLAGRQAQTFADIGAVGAAGSAANLSNLIQLGFLAGTLGERPVNAPQTNVLFT